MGARKQQKINLTIKTVPLKDTYVLDLLARWAVRELIKEQEEAKAK